jgi:DNA repair exonuclease SbcCD ATPase subunit
MIINSLRAENVLKYSKLLLEDIPEQGLIAVIGDNESGKSSIGESICFALFGRTFSLDSAGLDKVIRWGESRCSIKLEFTTPNRRRYQVARFLDELANHGASIRRVGEEPMVRGVDEVEARLEDIIGFGYREFIESFYLAQREITTPHPHSFAVKAMAGVDALEKVVAACEGELKQAGTKTEETEKQKADIAEQVAELGLEEGHLASLEAEGARERLALAEDRQQLSELKDKAETIDGALAALKVQSANWLAVPVDASFDHRLRQAQELDELVADLEDHCAEAEQTLSPLADLTSLAREWRDGIDAFDALRQRATAYNNWLGRLLGNAESADHASSEPTFAARRGALLQHRIRATSTRRVARISMFACLFVALILWGLSGLMGLAPTSPQAQAFSGWVDGLVVGGGGMVLPWLTGAAVLATLLFLGLMSNGIRLRRKIRDLDRSRAQLVDEEETARREADSLADLDQMPLREAVEMLARLRDEAIAEKVPDYYAGPGATLLDSERHEAGQARFRRIVDALADGVEKAKANAELQTDRVHESIAQRSSAIARLEELMSGERERIRRHRERTEIVNSLAEKIEYLQRRFRVRKLAIELLQGAIRYISQRFNTEVRNLSASSLPTLTNGRYEHLQIDENLSVKAFSNEKRDFMDLDEISSGTQRQIMLAVRLALSQKLVNSVIRGPQMLFLDEPFAFFDEGRTASALSILPQVSNDFSQIWVTSQTFPPKSRFDLYVECNAKETRSPVVRHGKSATTRSPNPSDRVS